MGVVTMFAVGIDELRDLFGGSPAAAGRLRALAASAIPPAAPPGPHGNRLARLGPCSRRATGAPVVHPGVPSGRDLDDVVHGRDVAPERLPAAWALVRLWLADAAWGRHAFVLPDGGVDRFDFELGAAGVDPRLSVRALFSGGLGVPLRALPGQASGYVRSAHAGAMARAWDAALDALGPVDRDVAAPVATWLRGCAGWEAAAPGAGRPAPDLVALLDADAAG